MPGPKVRLFRLYYRFSNWLRWLGRYSKRPTSTLQLPGPAGPVAARLYGGAGVAERPLILYFHGGGWVIGDLQTHHPFCQALAERCQVNVLAVDYRLAPEHPYPAAQEDCLAAAEWAAQRLEDLGPNNGAMVIAGDSAGGNLTAVTCLGLSDPARAVLAGAVTIYPAVDHYESGWLSYTERARARPLTFNIMRWFWDTYLAGRTPAEAMAARPIHSDRLHALPPLFNITAEFDPLRDEGRAFAKAAVAAGVATRSRHFERAAHGFACSSGPNRDHRSFLDDLAMWLDELPAA